MKEKELVPDGWPWPGQDEVYDGFFWAVRAPEGHGRNCNALIDSIATGNINAGEVPFRLILNNDGSIGPGAKKMAAEFVDLIFVDLIFVDLIQEIGGRRCPVEIITEK
jgi:hypothetical protein